MANISLLGASYSDVPAVVLPTTDDSTATFYELPLLWLPPSAELVSTAEETLNVSADTDYNSWTPTTTNTSILAAGTARTACSYTLTGDDITDSALLGVCCFNTAYAYPEGTTMAKGYPLYKIIYGISMYSAAQAVEYNNSDYAFCWSGAYGRQTYYSNSSTKALYQSASYGLGCTGVTWSTNSYTSLSTRVVGYTRPAIYARCHSSYFSTAAAAALDSANTNITFKYRIYKIPKAQSLLYNVFDYTNGVIFQ